MWWGVLVWLAWAAMSLGQGQGGESILRSAEEVRRLSTEEAARGRLVELEGVMTFFGPKQFSRFLQDASAGIYLTEFKGYPELQVGDVVKLWGRTDAGEYAPVVRPEKVERVGRRDLPSASRVTFEELAGGREDSQWVEVSGIVRQVVREAGRAVALDLAMGGGRLRVETGAVELPPGETWVDCLVRVRGVCSSSFNRGRQLFRSRLLVPRAEDLLVVERPAGDPFALEVQPLGSLMRFAPQGSLGHRIKVKGTVVYQGAAGFCLVDGKQGLLVESTQKGRASPGDVLECLGFPRPGEYTPLLEDAEWRKVGTQPVPPAAVVPIDELLKGDYDCRLVSLEGRLLERTVRSAETRLVMESDYGVWSVWLENAEALRGVDVLENGSWLRVTGICRLEVGQEWRAGEEWRAEGFHLVARQASDLVLLKKPAWWTLKRLFWLILVLLAVGLATLVWIGQLRRQVKEQTRFIREQLAREEGLRERYQSLIENADDMVYTHDAEGKVTSMNPAGALLLGREKEELIGQKLADLMAGEDREAAEAWMQGLAHGRVAVPGEWDFLTRSGDRVRLEIHPRLIQGPGGLDEVEGIARDVTEQRRLEREVLDVSTREQRRIAHDLHDGVCQQLAGLAYLADILAERLEEQAEPEDALAARRISEAFNRVNQQTRNVARGLFPVALEENGLVSALTELVANASEFFNIRCEFRAPVAVTLKEGIVAHHLFYIAQEAMLNAARHGQPAHILVTLAPDDGRFILEITDDGCGLPEGAARPESMGLRIMYYRARQIGAGLEVKSRPEGGTTVCCSFQAGLTGAPLPPRP